MDEKLSQQIKNALLEKSYTLYEINKFIDILDELSGVFEWRRAGRWSDETRRKHSEATKSYFQRNRDLAEFSIVPVSYPDLALKIVGWGALVDFLGLKETTLRTMFSIAEVKNIIQRDVIINHKEYFAEIEYRGVLSETAN